MAIAVHLAAQRTRVVPRLPLAHPADRTARVDGGVLLRRRQAETPFRVPLYPLLPSLFLGIYALLFVVSARAQPLLAGITVALLGLTYLAGVMTTPEPRPGTSPAVP